MSWSCRSRGPHERGLCAFRPLKRIGPVRPCPRGEIAAGSDGPVSVSSVPFVSFRSCARSVSRYGLHTGALHRRERVRRLTGRPSSLPRRRYRRVFNGSFIDRGFTTIRPYSADPPLSSHRPRRDRRRRTGRSCGGRGGVIGSPEFGRRRPPLPADRDRGRSLGARAVRAGVIVHRRGHLNLRLP